MNRIVCLIPTFLLLAVTTLACKPGEVKPPQRPATVAVVLGAGAARGFAHIGVLKILESNKVPIHMIVGTSAGSFVGSLYAYGFNAFQLQKMAFDLEKSDIVDLTLPDNGFIKGEKLEEYVNKMVRGAPLEKLRIPFYAVATDLQSGTEMVFGKGNTGTAVRASCSVPGVFRPVKIDGKTYVDGGVSSPVAVDAARRLGADVVLVVDVSSEIGTAQPESTIDTILQVVNIMYAKLGAFQHAKAEVVIKPKVGFIASGDFTKRHEAVMEGEKAALEAMPVIQKVLSRLRTEGRL